MQKEIEEGNRLIAEFMGGEFVKEIEGIPYWKAPADCPNPYNASQGAFNYLKSWDWIIPVVQKISGLRGDHLLMSGSIITHVNNVGRIKRALMKLDREAVWLAVVEFIKHHNSQNHSDEKPRSES